MPPPESQSASVPPEPPALRVLFFGMHGSFSLAPLAALIAAGVPVRAVLLPGEPDHHEPHPPPLRPLVPQRVARSTLPVLTPYREPSIVTLAWEHAIPVFEVFREQDHQTIAALAELTPDVASVACWPRRLPSALLALPRLGALNLHPSLLPAHRGPEPLFWTLRHGDERAGVTIHLMDHTLDGGDILAQQPVDLPDGIGGAPLEARCATVGGRVLVRVLEALAAGTAQRTPQPAGEGSYESWPTPDDFVVTPDRPARWAFNFLCGAGYWGGPLTIALPDRRLVVRAALDYDATAELGAAVRLEAGELWLQCNPGILHALVE